VQCLTKEHPARAGQRLSVDAHAARHQQSLGGAMSVCMADVKREGTRGRVSGLRRAHFHL
jgi:hypothetical protein